MVLRGNASSLMKTWYRFVTSWCKGCRCGSGNSLRRFYDNEEYQQKLPHNFFHVVLTSINTYKAIVKINYGNKYNVHTMLNDFLLLKFCDFILNGACRIIYVFYQLRRYSAENSTAPRIHCLHFSSLFLIVEATNITTTIMQSSFQNTIFTQHEIFLLKYK